MKLTFLGTGAAKPSKHRQLSAVILDMVEEFGNAWLFDCGEGAQYQILHLPLKLSQISHIFITHLHGDHLFGLPGLLGSRSFEEATKPVCLYGPVGLKSFINTVFETSQTYIRYPLNITEVTSWDTFTFDRFQVEASRLEHGLPSFGYRVTEIKAGALNVTKLKAQGILPGPIYGELKLGKTVTLPDGRIIHGSDFVEPPRINRIVTICGDTRLCQGTRNLAKDCSVLVHEATFAGEHESKAEEFYHSTAAQAASLANQANCKSLILNHISPRYLDGGENLLSQARAIFPNTYLASDLSEFAVSITGATPLD